MNKGTIPNLPSSISVETHVKADGKGIHPIPKEPIPDKLHKYVMLPRIMRAEWALEANLKGQRHTCSLAHNGHKNKGHEANRQRHRCITKPSRKRGDGKTLQITDRSPKILDRLGKFLKIFGKFI
ncbi:MAG: hypothetical protein QXX94_05495 [Candidatus Bathyarchaeia archaeon]